VSNIERFRLVGQGLPYPFEGDHKGRPYISLVLDTPRLNRSDSLSIMKHTYARGYCGLSQVGVRRLCTLL